MTQKPAAFSLAFACISLLTLTACTVADKHFWEIPSTYNPHIAELRAHPEWGSMVIHNTVYCEKIGAEACGFFRSTAHAHYMLNHQILPPNAYPESMRMAADCWAARNADAAEVNAAYLFLSDTNRDADIPITGDPLERAEVIRNCATKAGNWSIAAK